VAETLDSVVNTQDDPVRQDPLVARVRAMLAECDPDVLAAVDDVDRTLILTTLRLDARERVRSSAYQAEVLARWAESYRNRSTR
jgi:hypothetical protein